MVTPERVLSVISKVCDSMYWGTVTFWGYFRILCLMPSSCANRPKNVCSVLVQLSGFICWSLPPLLLSMSSLVCLSFFTRWFPCIWGGGHLSSFILIVPQLKEFLAQFCCSVDQALMPSTSVLWVLRRVTSYNLSRIGWPGCPLRTHSDLEIGNSNAV